AYRIEFFGDEIDRIVEVDSLTGEVIGERESISLFPATHFMTNDEQLRRALGAISKEMKLQVKKFEGEGKLLEAERIKQRTTYDMEMMGEVGYTNGIENYSRHMEGDRKSTRLNSSHVSISYAVFCLKKKKSTCNL